MICTHECIYSYIIPLHDYMTLNFINKTYLYVHRYQYNRTSSAGHLEVGSNPLRACKVMELSNDGVVDSILDKLPTISPGGKRSCFIDL